MYTEQLILESNHCLGKKEYVKNIFHTVISISIRRQITNAMVAQLTQDNYVMLFSFLALLPPSPWVKCLVNHLATVT